jgi:hypothetical protein
VQTPGFSAPGKKTPAPGKKTPAPAEKFQWKFHISKWMHYLFFILTLRMNISHYVCGEPTQYQCEYLLFRRWILVFSPMSDSSLQHK